MESILCGNDFGASGQPGDLEGRLIGFGAGVAEEHPGRQIGTEMGHQLFGQRDAGLGGVQVRHMTQRVQLSGDGLDDRRVPVAENVDGDTGQQIQIGLTVDIGHHRALAGDQCQRRGAVVVHHDRLPPVENGTHRMTFVPEPESLNSAACTLWATRPSIT